MKVWMMMLMAVCLTVNGVAGIVLMDDFESEGARNNWTIGTATGYYSGYWNVYDYNGTKVMRQTTGDRTFLYRTFEPVAGDISLSTSYGTRYGTTGNAWIRMGIGLFNSSGQGYLLKMHYNGVWNFLRVDDGGDLTAAADTEPACTIATGNTGPLLASGMTDGLMIEWLGGTIRVSQGGSEILSVADGTYTVFDRVALFSFNGSENHQWDNLVVASIPEPATLALLVLGGALMVRCRKQ